MIFDANILNFLFETKCVFQIGFGYGIIGNSFFTGKYSSRTEKTGNLEI